MFQRITSLTLLAVFGAVPLLAQNTPPEARETMMVYRGVAAATWVGGNVPDEILQRAAGALKLSETQIAAVRALLNVRNQTNQAVWEEMRQKQEELQSLMTQNNPNPSDLGNAFLAVRSVQERLNQAEEKFRTDFGALLSAEQRSTLEALKAAAGQIEALRIMGVLGDAVPGVPVPMPVPLPHGAFGAGDHIGIVAPAGGAEIRRFEVRRPPAPPQ